MAGFDRSQFYWQCYLCQEWKMITDAQVVRCIKDHAQEGRLAKKDQVVNLRCARCRKEFTKPGNHTNWEFFCQQHLNHCNPNASQSAPTTPQSSPQQPLSGFATAPTIHRRPTGVVRILSTPTKPPPEATQPTNYSASLQATQPTNYSASTVNVHSPLNTTVEQDIASNPTPAELTPGNNLLSTFDSASTCESDQTDVMDTKSATTIGWVYVIRIPIVISVYSNIIPPLCLLKIGKCGEREMKKANNLDPFKCLVQRLYQLKVGWSPFSTLEIPSTVNEFNESTNFKDLGCLLACNESGSKLADRERFFLGTPVPKTELLEFFHEQMLGLTEYVITTEHAFLSLQALYWDLGEKLSMNLINQTLQGQYEYYPRIQTRFQLGNLQKDLWLAVRISNEEKESFKMDCMTRAFALLNSPPYNIKTEK